MSALILAAAVAVPASTAPGQTAPSGPAGKVAYVTGGSAESWIAAKNLQGGPARRLTKPFPGVGSLHDLAWSPNGRWLAFAYIAYTGDGPPAGIYVIRADGTRLKRLRTVEATEEAALVWSPTSDSLAYDRNWGRRPVEYPLCDDGPVDLSVDVTTLGGRTSTVRLPRDPRHESTLGTIGWSPRGHRLLVTVTRWLDGHGGECDWDSSKLLSVPSRGGPRTVVLESDEGISDAQWSPDGTRIAYTAFSTETGYLVANLFVVAPNGSGGREIQADVGNFAWTVDGEHLLLSEPGSLGLKDIAGAGTLRPIASWTPSGEYGWPIGAVSATWVALDGGDRYVVVPLDGGRVFRVRDPRGNAWYGSSSITLR